ncbi:MAG: 2-hydroxyacyl-CoA dehydratase subunit D [Frisingicoccus sp.]
MRTIAEIIKEFKEIADHPKKAMEDYKRNGKGAVGIMPVYCPEEIVHAAGYLPMGMWGTQKKTISKARTYWPPFACSIMQSITELMAEGVYDDLEAVIFSVPCDTLKCMSQKWQGKAPAIIFTHPQNRKDAYAVANVFCREEYAIVKEKLENILDVTITTKALQKSIDIYNENRRTCREFCDIVTYAGLIKPSERHAVLKARWFMEKSNIPRFLKNSMKRFRRNRSRNLRERESLSQVLWRSHMKCWIFLKKMVLPLWLMTLLRNPASSVKMFRRMRTH